MPSVIRRQRLASRSSHLPIHHGSVPAATATVRRPGPDVSCAAEDTADNPALSRPLPTSPSLAAVPARPPATTSRAARPLPLLLAVEPRPPPPRPRPPPPRSATTARAAARLPRPRLAVSRPRLSTLAVSAASRLPALPAPSTQSSSSPLRPRAAVVLVLSAVLLPAVRLPLVSCFLASSSVVV